MIKIEQVDNDSYPYVRELVVNAYLESPIADKTTFDGDNLANEFMRQDFKRIARDIDNDWIIGGISGSMIRNVNHELVAVETMWFVEESYRNTTKAGPLLFEAFERWAKDANCTSICVSHYHGDTRVGNFYQRKGYTPVEVTYRKVI